MGGPASTALGVSGELDRRYLIRRLIARGAGCDVLEALHRHTERVVAIKTPRTDEHRSAGWDRLWREVSALALLRGAAVPELLDAGDVDGVPYLVMELLEGRTLAGLLAARGRLGIAEVIKIGAEVAAVLGVCHARGVLHRDVKPENLFVGRDARGQLRLLDFAVALTPGSDASADATLCLRGAPLGTPGYAAPELESSPSSQTDAHALGATLYECLTGELPTDPAAARSHLVRDRSDVPPTLATLIGSCLVPNPNERVADLSRFASELVALSAVPVEQVNLLRPAGTPSQPPKAEPAPPAEPSADAGASRRRHPRAAYVSPVHLVTAVGTAIDGRLEEVSEGGLQLIAPKPLGIGAEVKLRFALPNNGRIAAAVAVVRWARSTGVGHAMGLEFTELADDAKRALAQYVQILGGE